MPPGTRSSLSLNGQTHLGGPPGAPPDAPQGGASGRNGFGNQKSGRNAQDGSTDDELLCSRKKQPATMRVGVLVARGGAALGRR